MSYKSKGLKKPVHHKKKTKKSKNKPSAKRQKVNNSLNLDAYKEMITDKPKLVEGINALIEKVVSIFKEYDRIQILGGLGLKLIENLPTLEKMFEAQMNGKGELKLDEEAEVVMEYAMNFGTALPYESVVAPTKEVLSELYDILGALPHLYNMHDTPTNNNDYEAWLTWMVHMDHIFVRGDGYASIVEEVYDELFMPHDAFFKQRYGFSLATLKAFCTEIERFILSKIGNATGAYMAWERWKEDSEKQYGTGDEAIERMLQDKPENGVMGSLIDRSPDMFGDNPMHLLMYQPDDFGSSDKIFWVVPQNEEEKALYEVLSCELGDNAAFLAEGDYKGNIMSGMKLFRKPLVKVGDKYYCFTPMIPHRNMFALTEALLKEDNAYYDSHYRNNTDPNSRDQYMERKVVERLKSLLPEAKVYHSAGYNTVDDGKSVNTELDILCVSDMAAYVIEIKGHELSNADKVKINGFKVKFKESVGYGCHQVCRAENHIKNEDGVFRVEGETIKVDRELPVYKAVVTLQHFSSVIGHFDYLVKCGLMEKEYWNVWAVSLFDFMVVADNIDSEAKLIGYLEAHNRVQDAGIEFPDELNVFARYLDGRIEKDIKDGLPFITDGKEVFDAKYEQGLSINVK